MDGTFAAGTLTGRFFADAHTVMADHGAKREKFGELPGDVGQETIEFRLDHLATLAEPRLQARAIEHGDPASVVTDQPGILQLAGGLGDAFRAWV
jgi:hypothetical protein